MLSWLLVPLAAFRPWHSATTEAMADPNKTKRWSCARLLCEDCSSCGRLRAWKCAATAHGELLSACAHGSASMIARMNVGHTGPRGPIRLPTRLFVSVSCPCCMRSGMRRGSAVWGREESGAIGIAMWREQERKFERGVTPRR